MSSQSNLSVLATVIVGIIIVIGFVGYGYYKTSSDLSSLSQQNSVLGQQVANLGQQNSNLGQQVSSQNQQMSSLNHEVSNLNQQVSGANQQISGLIQQVYTLEQRTIEVVTQTNSEVYVESTTSITTVTSISTSSVFPVPDNVTILFTKVSGGYDYTITAGSSTYSGSQSAAFAVPISPVFKGETISISASETGLAGCVIGQTVTAELYLNGQVVAQGTQECTGSNIQLTYTI